MNVDDRDEGASGPAAASADPAAAPEPPAPDAVLTPAPDGAQGAEAEVAPEATDAPRRTFFRRFREVVHLPRTRRGLIALLLVLGAVLSMFVVGATSVIAWTETDDFCGRCHTMGPEVVAHTNGPHSDVTCGECHVSRGDDGWIKAKMLGTRQLIEFVLGTFPEPIPPPDHDSLPPPSETCQRCHKLDRVGTAALVTRTQYTEDLENTRQFIGLMIRPGGGDVFDVGRSVHWHVLADVEFRSDDESGQSVRWVGVTREDGTTEEYIRQDEIRLAEDVRPDLERIRAESVARPMDCISCHNRVGHPLPNPRRSLDAALASGKIDPELPYIKREGMRLLWSNFATDAAAEAAIDKLRDFYELRYPEIADRRADDVTAAIEEIKVLYRLTATPVMRVTATTYPDNLGHTDFAGCFRCHDGGHSLVENGVATKKTIPSSCDTCHTFPQIGAVASLPLGVPPDTHDDRLWVFNHRLEATGVDPRASTCGECHARDYCSNCHATGAIKVDHDQMLTNHASVIRESGPNACAYCHQPVYCARCHSEPVLPGSAPFISGSLNESPPGLRWPLVLTASRP